MTATNNARLADAYAHIAAHPGATVGDLGPYGNWAVEVLLVKGMIVRLVNVPGVHCVESRYATVRAVAQQGL